MRRNICIVLATIVCVFCVTQATAKVYWLPDYLRDNIDRVNSHFKSDGVTPDSKATLTCPSGCVTSAEKGLMVCAYVIPVSGIGNCYCECETEAEDTCIDVPEISSCGEVGCKTESVPVLVNAKNVIPIIVTTEKIS